MDSRGRGRGRASVAQDDGVRVGCHADHVQMVRANTVRVTPDAVPPVQCTQRLQVVHDGQAHSIALDDRHEPHSCPDRSGGQPRVRRR